MMIPSNVDVNPGLSRTNVDDWRALGDLVGLATKRLTAPIEDTHHAIADRWFGLSGRAESQAHLAYRGLSRGIYDTIRGAGSAAKMTIAVGAAAIGDATTVRPLWSSRRGAGIQAAANALWGDEFARNQSRMHIEFGFRDSDGASVGADTSSLEQAFSKPEHRVVVLLHGLGHTERCWQGQAKDDGAALGMVDALEADSFTPLCVRYNTGMPVSHNGGKLSQLLDEIVANWPVDVHEIALVGHSMGALVARSSVVTGIAAGSAWISRVRHMVSIGGPHHGSPIEKAIHVASRALSRSPEGRPLGTFIDERSAGIKDMRFGSVRDASESKPIDQTQRERSVIPLVNTIEHHCVAGVVTKSARHPLGVMVGDLVVRQGSATGIGSRGALDVSNVRVFVRQTHPGLLEDPAVHRQVRDWLTPTPVGSVMS